MTIQQIGLVDRLFMRRSRIDVNIVVECAEPPRYLVELAREKKKL